MKPFLGGAWVATYILITRSDTVYPVLSLHAHLTHLCVLSVLVQSVSKFFSHVRVQSHIVWLHVCTHGRNSFIDYYVNTTSDIMAPHCDFLQSCSLWFRAIAKSVSLFKLYAVLNWLIVNISSYYLFGIFLEWRDPTLYFCCFSQHRATPGFPQCDDTVGKLSANAGT